MATLQHLPYLGTAEDDVLFVEWLVDEGAFVKPGTPIATVETLKAAFDVEAEADGVLLKKLCAPGERIAVQAPIGVLGAAGERFDDGVLAALLGPARAQTPAAGTPAAATVAPAPFAAGGAAPVAPAAKQRARELGVDLASVTGTGPGGLIRAADVDRAHAARTTADATAARAPATPRRISPEGRVDPDFLAAIKKDPGFAALSSELKVLLYRRHGAVLGADCRFGQNAVLRCEHVVLGDGAYFGADTTVEGRELRAGPLLHFGARCRVRTTRVVCGENAFFTDDIEVGGGGAMDPEAELVVGSHGFVGEHSHLNTCRTLRLGDEVVISRSACLMTHSFGPNWLAGYPSRFAGVTVGDGAQIGIGAVLFPGVEVGAGAVVLSGSSVVTSVPPGRLFGGVPAQDLKAAAQQLTPAQLAERAQSLVEEFVRQLGLRGRRASHAPAGHGTLVQVAHDDGTHVLQFAAKALFPLAKGGVETVVVAVDFPDDLFAATPPNVTAIGLSPPRIRGPIGPLAAAFREFLRKRGCRLHPRTWAYTGGWL